MGLLKKLGQWLVDYWFSALLTALVVASAVWAIAIGLAVPVPDPVPEYALRSSAVYRLEVSGAWFAIVYLMIMAIALAFSGRGFIRFGARGVEPGKLLKTRKARRKTSRSIRRLQSGANKTRLMVNVLRAGVIDLNHRHEQTADGQRLQDAAIQELRESIVAVVQRQEASEKAIAELRRLIDTPLS